MCETCPRHNFSPGRLNSLFIPSQHSTLPIQRGREMALSQFDPNKSTFAAALSLVPAPCSINALSVVLRKSMISHSLSLPFLESPPGAPSPSLVFSLISLLLIPNNPWAAPAPLQAPRRELPALPCRAQPGIPHFNSLLPGSSLRC